ncbi:MAG: MDR/zinc-dependent alcohol dehydrogenase-like family protein [Gemmatimonadota bacterium]
MRSARLVEPNRFDVEWREAAPEPGPDEVLVRVRGCGVCASNLGPWTGDAGIAYPLPPGAPGHEVYGTVAAFGSDVRGIEVGAAVTALSHHGFADYDLVGADAVVPLPDAVADRPLPGEPVACAVNVARRADVEAGDDVVVLGAGFLGTLVVRLARHAGAGRIVAVSRRRESLALAERMGADETLTYGEDVVGRVEALTDGRLADVVVEATGKAGPLELAAALTRVRGRLVVAGYHQDGRRNVNMQLWNWRGLDVINAHERDPAIYLRGMREAVRLVVEGKLELEPLLTHFVALDEINRAFRLAEARPAGFVKAVVTTEDG